MAQDIGGASRLYLKTLFETGSLAGLTDGQLLERFATGRGDAAELAFAALVERHGPMVHRACRSILRDDHEAMDAFQATFLVLVRKGRSLWVRDSLGPWLHRVACRAAGRARAEADRRSALERKFAEATISRTGDDERSRLAAAVQEEVDRLPDRFRVPIVLCDLEGHTCEEAARHLGCPVGTIGSRLARGRERLRSRLARRGLAPVIWAGFPGRSTTNLREAMPAPLVEATARLGRCIAMGERGVGTFPAAAAQIAEDLLRSWLMLKIISVGTATLVAACFGLTANWALQPGVGAQVLVPPAAVGASPRDDSVSEPIDDFPFVSPERFKDWRHATIGNMYPLIEGKKGPDFQSRAAILYKDGTVKLWSNRQKDPVAPDLRHDGPIKELRFLDELNLLITTSNESVKVWDGLKGELRKELNGESIRPIWLAFAPDVKQFVTIDTGRKAVTVRDAVSLATVTTLRLEGATDRVDAAGLSGDGKTVVTFRFGEDPSAVLWDVASSQPFATLRPPSSALAYVFNEKGTDLDSDKAKHGAPFWEVVRYLAPTAKK